MDDYETLAHRLVGIGATPKVVLEDIDARWESCDSKTSVGEVMDRILDDYAMTFNTELGYTHEMKVEALATRFRGQIRKVA